MNTDTVNKAETLREIIHRCILETDVILYTTGGVAYDSSEDNEEFSA